MAGRPPIYSTPEELEAAIEDYFNPMVITEEETHCGTFTGTTGKREPRQKVTITGLAYHLGFSDRQSLYDYEEKEQFSCIIKRARLRVEMSYEERLLDGNCTGAIFALKNMGWKDSQEVKHSGGTENKNEISISDLPDELARQILANRTKEA